MKENNISRELIEKLEKLKNIIKSYGSLAVGYSSGVDSTLLLKVASEVLNDKCIAITAVADFFPQSETLEAKKFCEQNNIKHIVLKIEMNDIEGFSKNPKNRCYFCKKALFTWIKNEASKYDINTIAEASNMDDNSDYRPGHIAIKELGIKSPLREAGLTKAEIRELSRYMELYTWKKPSFACLASRIQYGEAITSESLKMVEKAESMLMTRGYMGIRVRKHGELARIEINEKDFERMMDKKEREEVDSELKKIGFKYVALDLLGYRQGSMNEVLTENERNLSKE